MKNKILLFIIIFAFVLYILTIRGIYGNPKGASIKNNLDQATKPFELSPERDRYILIMSLAKDRTFSLSQSLADAAYPDVGYYKRKFYIFFPPGISIIAMPFYLLGSSYNLSQVAAFSSVTLFALFNILLLFLISKNVFKLPLWISTFIPVIFAFASTSWSYAITLYQHQITTFFILSSFYAVWNIKKNKKDSIILGAFIWFNYAFAILIDYPNALLMLPVMVYYLLTSIGIKKLKSKISFNFNIAILITFLVFVVITGIHAYYNYVNFGSPTKVSSSLIGYKQIKEQNLLKEKGGQKVIQQVQRDKNPIGFFSEQEFPFGIYELLIAPDKGIFIFSPIFVLAILGIFSVIKFMDLEKSILLATVIAVVFLYSSWGDPWGGWAYGPRYLIPAMAPLSIFIGIFLKKYNSFISKAITFILFAYSAAVALLGALTTNAVPPKVEADYLKMKYGFLLNFDFLTSGRSGSFIYNQFFANSIHLVNYYIVILLSLLILALIILFYLPLKENEH